MIRKLPAAGFIISILAYFALWILVPRATFLPIILDAINSAMHFLGGGRAGFTLAIASFIITAAPTVAFMAIQIAIIYFFARFRMQFWGALLILVGCLAGTALLLNGLILHSGIAAKIGHYPNLREQMFIMGNYFGPLKMPMAVLIMLAAASIGYLVNLRVKDVNLLLPVVMFAAYIDFWTVTRGPVATMLKHAPDVASAVSAPIPQAGAGTFMPVTMIGPGDFLFMALVFAVVHRLKLNGPRNFLFVCTMMTLGMLAVMFGLLQSLPALIVLAVAVVAANRKQFHPSRDEKISMVVVGILLLASLPLVWSVMKPKMEKKPA